MGLSCRGEYSRAVLEHPVGPGGPPYVARTLGLRLVGVVGLGCAAIAVTMLASWGSTRVAIRYFAYYRPVVLPTRPQTLFGSAIYLSHVGMLGPTTFFALLLFLPYALIRGVGWSLGVFFTGHVVSTIAIAIVFFPLDWAGSHWAVHVIHAGDVGASAGLAACAGALAACIGRRHRYLGGAVATALYGYFVRSLVRGHGLAQIADIEHLTALTVGVLFEVLWFDHNGGAFWPRAWRSERPPCPQRS